MLRWAFIFLIIAIVAGILGFTDVEFVSATIARVLFGIFLSGSLPIVLFGFILGSWLSPRYGRRGTARFCSSTGLCAELFTASKTGSELSHFEPFLWQRSPKIL